MIDRNKAKGMLWGLVVGDCLGSPIQFSGKDDHPWITEMEYCPVFNLPPGYWTDDSSMAFCIMESFIEKGRYDLKDIANNFVQWHGHGFWSSIEGKAFDIGFATSSACLAIRDRGSLVNGREDSQGNGSIMRFAPSYLIAQREPDPRKVMHEISDLTHASSGVRKVVDDLAGVLAEHLAGRRTKVGPGSELPRERVPNSGWSVDSLTAALWAFNTTATFEEGMIAAVNLGGDSDSIGAIYGQIAGAYYGFDAIPQRWVKKVKTPEDVENEINSFLTRVLTPA